MSTIERQVMASVGVIYAVRRLLSRTALKLYVCVASLWGIGQLVWVSRVFENVPHTSFAALWRFIFSAVLNTELFVQLVLLVGVLAFISFVIDLARSNQRQTSLA